jgi:hypothetical protein
MQFDLRRALLQSWTLGRILMEVQKLARAK